MPARSNIGVPPERATMNDRAAQRVDLAELSTEGVSIGWIMLDQDRERGRHSEAHLGAPTVAHEVLPHDHSVNQGLLKLLLLNCGEKSMVSDSDRRVVVF